MKMNFMDHKERDQSIQKKEVVLGREEVVMKVKEVTLKWEDLREIMDQAQENLRKVEEIK